MDHIKIQKEIVRILESIEQLEKSAICELAEISPQLKNELLDVLMEKGLEFSHDQLNPEKLKKIQHLVEELKKFPDSKDLNIVKSDLRNFHFDI